MDRTGDEGREIVAGELKGTTSPPGSSHRAVPSDLRYPPFRVGHTLVDAVRRPRIGVHKNGNGDRRDERCVAGHRGRGVVLGDQAHPPALKVVAWRSDPVATHKLLARSRVIIPQFFHSSFWKLHISTCFHASDFTSRKAVEMI